MADNQAITKLFPLPLADERVLAGRSNAKLIGVAVSGGGSRSLSAAMGQLRALRYLGHLDDVLFISSVSGGTWASAAFTYLPMEFSDDEFLGLPVLDPGKLTVEQHSGEPNEQALDYLPPNNLGQAPTRLGFLRDLELIRHLKDKYHYADDVLWQGIIGERIFQLWNLWKVGSDGLPLRSYSFGAPYLEQNVLADNPRLHASDFNLVERNRPLLIMNGSIFSNPQDTGAQLLPFESTAFGIGVRNAFTKADTGPGGRTIGGGEIQPFAMGSAWVQDLPGQRAAATIPSRPFSIVDMASISSAAFAEAIQATHPDFDCLLPKYQYWPVAKRETTPPYDYYFADGGNLENTGVLALLARNVTRVIAFVNTATPLKNDSGQITFSSDISLLFGVVAAPKSAQHKESKQQVPPNGDPGFNQVFAREKHDELVAAMWQKNGVNGEPAVIKQTLTVMPNANFGIAGNYDVEILWVYNTAVPKWRSLLSADVRTWLDLGGAPNFPNYNTILQLGLSPREVNLLAQLSFWVVVQEKDLVQSMFA